MTRGQQLAGEYDAAAAEMQAAGTSSDFAATRAALERFWCAEARLAEHAFRHGAVVHGGRVFCADRPTRLRVYRLEQPD